MGADEFDYEAYAAESRWDDCLRRLGFVNEDCGPSYKGTLCYRFRRSALYAWPNSPTPRTTVPTIRFAAAYRYSRIKLRVMAEHDCELPYVMAYARLLLPIARRLRLNSYEGSVAGALRHAYTCVIVERGDCAPIPPTEAGAPGCGLRHQ